MKEYTITLIIDGYQASKTVKGLDELIAVLTASRNIASVDNNSITITNK